MTHTISTPIWNHFLNCCISSSFPYFDLGPIPTNYSLWSLIFMRLILIVILFCPIKSSNKFIKKTFNMNWTFISITSKTKHHWVIRFCGLFQTTVTIIFQCCTFFDLNNWNLAIPSIFISIQNIWFQKSKQRFWKIRKLFRYLLANFNR